MRVKKRKVFVEHLLRVKLFQKLFGKCSVHTLRNGQGSDHCPQLRESNQKTALYGLFCPSCEDTGRGKTCVFLRY